MEAPRPAWSWQFAPERLRKVPAVPVLDEITPAWAWDGGTGAGVKVAVVDSGIDNDHPAVAGRVRGYISFTEDRNGVMHVSEEPHTDAFGHGTACADIIRRLAPECDLYSVKVLGPMLTGKGTAFAAGLRWAIEQGMHVINLSLGTTKQDYFALFHELADMAYFRNVVLVTAANNMPVISYPSLFAAVISVACHDGQDPYEFYYNPEPPVEFGAPGINVRVAWLGGGYMTVTGNSFAAPHITGLVAKILSKHPGLTPFQVKTILRATGRNVYQGDGGGVPLRAGERTTGDSPSASADAAPI
jgi:subtilisin family serine protease